MTNRDSNRGGQETILCDRCNCPVPPDNDAFLLNIEVEKILKSKGKARVRQILKLWGCVLPNRNSSRHRHLFPIISLDDKGKGKVDCLGSPSRAQYFLGQPKDARQGMSYDPQLESLFCTAYQRLLRYGKRGKKKV